MISQIFHANDFKMFSKLCLQISLFSSPHFKKTYDRVQTIVKDNILYSTLNKIRCPSSVCGAEDQVIITIIFQRLVLIYKSKVILMKRGKFI